MNMEGVANLIEMRDSEGMTPTTTLLYSQKRRKVMQYVLQCILCPPSKGNRFEDLGHSNLFVSWIGTTLIADFASFMTSYLRCDPVGRVVSIPHWPLWYHSEAWILLTRGVLPFWILGSQLCYTTTYLADPNLVLNQWILLQRARTNAHVFESLGTPWLDQKSVDPIKM